MIFSHNIKVALLIGGSLVCSTAVFAAQPNMNKMQVVNGVNSVEDLVEINANWVIGSSFSINAAPTGLYLFNTQHPQADYLDWNSVQVKPDKTHFPSCPGAPDFSKLSTHGLDYYQQAQMLYVVNHGGRESIEAFKVDTQHQDKPALSWVGCVIGPKNAYLDAVAGIENNQLVISSLWNPLDAEKEQKLKEGKAVGGLYNWSAEKGFVEIKGTEKLSGPNGVLATRDGKTIYIAAWSGKYIAKITQQNGTTHITKAAVSYHPDNLRWSPDKKSIYSGGQDASIPELFACLGDAGAVCPNIQLQLDKLDPVAMKTTTLIPAGTYQGLTAGTGAIKVGNNYWLSTFKNTEIGIVAAQ